MTNKIDIERDLPDLPEGYSWSLESERFNDQPDESPQVTVSVIRHDVVQSRGRAGTEGLETVIASSTIELADFTQGHHVDGKIAAAIFQAILARSGSLRVKALENRDERARNTEAADKARDAMNELGL